MRRNLSPEAPASEARGFFPNHQFPTPSANAGSGLEILVNTERKWKSVAFAREELVFI